jgi:hypothetical protein
MLNFRKAIYAFTGKTPTAAAKASEGKLDVEMPAPVDYGAPMAL